jgi:hypothetical protein
VFDLVLNEMKKVEGRIAVDQSRNRLLATATACGSKFLRRDCLPATATAHVTLLDRALLGTSTALTSQRTGDKTMTAPFVFKNEDSELLQLQGLLMTPL